MGKTYRKRGINGKRIGKRNETKDIQMKPNKKGSVLLTDTEILSDSCTQPSHALGKFIH